MNHVHDDCAPPELCGVVVKAEEMGEKWIR